MAELTYRDGGRARRSPRRWSATRRVVLIGEDVGGGRRRVQATEGLLERFGPERVRDTPISEQAIVGAAMGAAMTGLRPIAELMFSDFFAVAWDMVANQIAKTRYMTDGQVSLPLVIRTANGGGPALRRAAHARASRTGRWRSPASRSSRRRHPADMIGPDGGRDPRPRPGDLLRAQGAVRDEGRGPRRRASSTRSGPPGSSAPGGDATIVRARGDGARRRVAAAERLAAEHGIDAEVIDLRSLVPLDTADDPRARSRRPAGCSRSRRTRGCAAGARRSPRSSPTRASAASTRRSCGSPRRTSRCRRPPRSRTSRSRRSSGSSRRSSGAWTTPRDGSDPWPDRRSRARARAGWARRWPSASREPASTVVLWNRTPDRRTRARRAASAARSPRRRPRPPRPADVVDHDARRRRGGRDAVYAGPDGVARRRIRPGVGRGRHEHGPADARSRPSAGACRPGAGILDAPVSGSVALAERGKLTIMVGGDGGATSSVRGRSSTRSRGDVFHLGPLGHRRGHEAGRQHADLRAQPGRGRGARPRRARPASTGRWPTTSSPRARPARRWSATSAPRSSSPTTTPVAFSLDARGQGPAPHRRASPRPSASPCRRRARQPRRRSDGRRAHRSATSADFCGESRSHLRAGGPAMTDRP